MYTRIVPVKSINGYDAEKLIEIAECEYQSQISEIARAFSESMNEKPFLLLSGPSGSGKTVTSYRIKELLQNSGHTVKVLSMDNYFLPLDDPKNKRDIYGRIDLESPKRLDIDLLNEQMNMIWRHEEVEIPSFDFANQVRRKGSVYKRGKDDLIIMEGIHALNPEITGNLGEKARTLYVSVRTRIKKTDGELLHPSKIRLMRRLVRDNLFRGREFSQVFENFANVERGEELYIMPYKHLADFEMDTFMPFEPSVYKGFIGGKLKEPGHPEVAAEISSYFDELNTIDVQHVPEDSPVREFVGGNRLMRQ